MLLASLVPLSRLSLPSKEEIVRQIEEKSKLEHRPITAQNDSLELGANDDLSAALWREHQNRMSGNLQNMTSGTPAPRANLFDPFAVRAMLPILAFAAFFYSFSPNGGNISDVIGVAKGEQAVANRVDAWINPPAYTKKPPIYLTVENGNAPGSVISVPEGSEFFLRFIGNSEVNLQLSSDTEDVTIKPSKRDELLGETEFSLVLSDDSAIKLTRQQTQIAQWVMALVPDEAPQISFTEPPRSALSGSLELGYEVADDYGVVSANAVFKSLEEVDEAAEPLVEPPRLKLPLPRQRAKSGTSKVNRDLTEHPWAGSRVSITLEAVDDLEQVGRSQTREIVLPGRRFSKPLALALIEQRRILAMDARKKHRVADLLDAVSSGAPEFIDDAKVILGMRIAYRRIVDSNNHDDLRSALDLLWDIALGVEFGDLTEAERKLRDAQERLSEALERGASDEEIDRLMQELRQAMNEMMQALAEQARNNPQQQNPFDQSQMEQLTQNDLESMMDRIEDLAKSGSQDAARQLLSEMQRMMDNLRAGQHQQQRQAEGNEMNQALDKLSELMQRQQELLNETYQMQRQQEGQGQENTQNQNQQMRPQQGQNQQGQQQQGQSQQGQNRPMTAEEFAEALDRLRQQQEALQQQLGQLGEQLEGLGLQPSEELGNAGREMGEAGENLAQGNTPGAATDQGQALEALRKGAQNMMQQMAGDRNQGGEQQAQQGGQGGVRDNQRGNDPLGRDRNGQSNSVESDVQIPSEIDAQRARRILEAIRDRLSIPNNPLIERDYLERLLRSE